MGLINHDSLEEENKNLINNSNSSQQNGLWKNVSTVIHSVTYEPLPVILYFVHEMYSMISKQFIYQYFASEYGLNKTALDNSTHCDDKSYLEAEVSARSSEWVMYLNLAGFVPSLITSVVIGSWGDLVGRRLPFFIGYFGYFLLILIFILVMGLHLHIGYLIIGRVLFGLCGDIGIIFSTMYAYTSDISNNETRTLKLAVVEGLAGFGGIVGSMVGGFWVQKYGFIPPFIFCLVILFVTLIYISVFLPEARDLNQISLIEKSKSLFSLKAFVEMKRNLFSDFWQGVKILAVVACYFFRLIPMNGFMNVSIIYELSPPFCFSSIMVGYAYSAKLFSLIASMIFVKLTSGRISDFTIFTTGLLSNISTFLFYAFASQSWMLYVGIICGWLRGVQGTVIVSFISKLASKNSQGAVMAINSISGALSEIAATFIFNPVYSVTVGWFPGFVFLVLTGFQTFLFLLFTAVYLKIKTDLVNRDT